MIKYDYGDRTEESVLVIKDFQAEDLNREYNCSVRNQKGFATRRAQLEEEGQNKHIKHRNCHTDVFVMSCDVSVFVMSTCLSRCVTLCVLRCVFQCRCPQWSWVVVSA